MCITVYRLHTSIADPTGAQFGTLRGAAAGSPHIKSSPEAEILPKSGEMRPAAFPQHSRNSAERRGHTGHRASVLRPGGDDVFVVSGKLAFVEQNERFRLRKATRPQASFELLLLWSCYNALTPKHRSRYRS